MKIAVPADTKDINENVSISFGRSPFYLIYDTTDKTHEFIVNTAAQASGGAGIKAAMLIVDNKINTVLTPRCGDNAAEVLKNANIDIYKSIDATIMDNIKAFMDNKLQMLGEIHKGLHYQG